MPVGEKLTISACQIASGQGREQEPKMLQLLVKDSGAGMSEEVRRRMFEPFYSTKPADLGTGLGMSIVQETVAALGGQIDVQSQEGQGTSFVVQLPYSEIHDEASEQTPWPAPSAHNNHLLVVDDEESNCGLLSDSFTRWGYRVTTRISVNAALTLFQSEPTAFDLAIIDYTMPYVNGVELARQLRTRRRDIPIILLSGFTELLEKEADTLTVVSTVVHKPLQIAKIATTVRKLLRDV